MFRFTSPKERIDMDKAQTLLASNPQITLLDVRTEAEYRSGHIEHSINIPLDHISEVLTRLPKKDATYFVHCLSGGRSGSAVSYMMKMGYTDVTNIGGISSWNGKVIK